MRSRAVGKGDRSILLSTCEWVSFTVEKGTGPFFLSAGVYSYNKTTSKSSSSDLASVSTSTGLRHTRARGQTWCSLLRVIPGGRVAEADIGRLVCPKLATPSDVVA